MICNRISNSSKEWAENFAKYNSGTYNNQFMILDKNKINLVNKSIEYDAFYVVEQLPGFVKINNVTDIFKFGYWSSFNIPFDKEIYKLSGLKEVIDSKPEAASYLDYDISGRSKIFRRDQSTADNIDGFMTLMRYNNYLNDDFSEGNPSYAISARSDLKVNGSCGGAFDCKAGALSDWKEGKIKFHLVAGPTYGGVGNLEPFDFRTGPEKCRNIEHNLIPDVFKFDWTEYESEFPF